MKDNIIVVLCGRDSIYSNEKCIVGIKKDVLNNTPSAFLNKKSLRVCDEIICPLWGYDIRNLIINREVLLLISNRNEYKWRQITLKEKESFLENARELKKEVENTLETCLNRRTYSPKRI